MSYSVDRDFLGRELDELAEALALAESDRQRLLERSIRYAEPAIILLSLLRQNEVNNDEDALRAESLAYARCQAGALFREWLAQRPRRPHAAVSRQPPVLLRRDHEILYITLNRPEVRNAYSAAMRDDLFEALTLLEADSSIQKAVLRGAGDCFCVGGDLEEFGLAQDGSTAHRIRMSRNVPALLLRQRHRLECVVQRAAIGSGVELSACAGRVRASQDAFFQLPELAMGLIPGAGGTVSVLRRIGRHRLAWWVLTGKKINSRTALDWGLVDELYPRADVDSDK